MKCLLDVRLGRARCWVVLIVAALASAGLAQTPAEQQLLATVRTMYGASRKAITSVQCNYTFILNGDVRESHYRTDGHRFYQAGAGVLQRGGISMPDEASWDGRQAFHRYSLNGVTVSSDRERARVSCDTPESGVSRSADEALGLLPPRGEYPFLSARELQWEGHDCIELSWKIARINRIMTVRHGRDVGYWPVWQTLTDDAGKVVQEMSQVRYTQRESGGNVLFYPVLAVIRAEPDKPGNVLTWKVDESSLKLNEAIPITQFQIEFWPCDDVTDFETNKVRAALDPNWSPLGHAGFPWDKLLTLMAKTGLPLPGARPQAAQGVSPQTPALAAEAAAPAVIAPAPAPAFERALRWLIPAGGILCLAGIGYWLKQRRGA